MYLLGPDGPVRVVKVEEAGVYDVHDITVEDDHSYVSCGVFSHNSCNDPNLQNIPTRNKPKAKIVKRQFVAKRGRLMLKRDFSAHEVRMWGVASGDPKIGDVFWNGMQVRLRYEMQRAIPKEKEKFWQDELSAADVHRQNVNLFYGTDPRKVDDATRGSAKAIIFGAVYGKGIKSLAKDIKDTEEKARELWKLIFRKKFRVGGDWLLRTQKRAARTLIAKNVLGGVRHLYGYLHTDSSVHAAMNRRGPNCVDAKTECLTEDGWVRVKNLRAGDKIFTHNLNTGVLELQRVNALTKQKFCGRMLKLDGESINALVTPGHRWPVEERVRERRNGKKVDVGVRSIFVTSEEVATRNYRVRVLPAKIQAQKGGTWTDDEVALIGWVLTDGHYSGRRLGITQSSRGNPQKVEMIDALLGRLPIPNTGRGRHSENAVRWRFTCELGDRIRSALPDKVLTGGFLNSLSTKQLRVLFDTMLLGNGSFINRLSSYSSFGAGTRKKADAFSHLCVLLGVSHRVVSRMYKPSEWKYDSMPNVPQPSKRFWEVRLKCRDRAHTHHNKPRWVNYEGMVYCPTVDNRTFVCRRKGIVHVTGNSIVQGPSSNVGYEGGYFTRRLIWNLYESRGVDLGYLQCNAVHDCVVGDTLISTARGLYRIDELSSGRTKQLTIDVHSRYGIERTSKWINRGVRPVRRLVTAAGTIVEGTDNHEILIMREGDHTWIKMGEVRKNDLLCIPLRRNTNIAKLSLGITKYAPPSWVPNGCTDARPRTERWIASSLKDVRIPNTMSPELAFILGLLISEGTLRERLLCIPNTNYALLERARDYFVHVFGVEPKLLLNRRATARTGNKQYVLVLASKSVLNYLAQIGVVGGKTLRGKTPSYYKQIPWSILRADCESQLAFMAAYVEGDGTVGRYGLTIATTSRSLSLQMQQLFIHNGFLAARTWRKSSGAGKGYWNERGEKRIAYHVTLNTAASRDFFDAARAYFVSKYREIKHGGSSQKLPLSFVQDVIRSRRLGKGYYLNDEGVRVKCAIHANRMRDKYIDARALTTPKGAHFLRELKVISESTWSRLVALMQLPYAYTPVVRIQKTGEKPVYDLSIALGGEPAYVANGIVCHNSTECECDIVNIPLVEYLAFHGYTTLVHRWMMKTFGVDLKVGFEMDSEIGGSLAALKKAPRHDMQVDAIAAGIEWGNSELGWGLDLDAYMRRVKHNASIMFEVRRAEIKEQLARGTRTNTKMNVNYDNALKLGLIFDAPPEKRREGSSAKSSRTKSTMRELEDS